jgi:hypothetical protein
MKAIDLLTRALRAVGNVGSGETPNADDINTAFAALNDMLDSWGTSKLFVYQLAEQSFPLASGKSSYLIGPGADFDTVRPTRIDSAYVRLGQTDYPLDPIDNDAYSNITLKGSAPALPKFFYYNPQMPAGELNLWPVPQGALTIFIQSPQQLTQFPDQVTDIAFPPGYAEAIRYGVMPRLAAEGLGRVTPQQQQMAESSVARIKTLNSRVPVLRPAYGADAGGRFNINRGF